MSEFESDLTGGEEYVKIVDVNLDTVGSRNKAYVVTQGAQNISYTNLLSSSASNQSTNWIMPSAGNNVCRSSKIMIGMTVTASITCSNTTTGAINIIQGNNFGLRARPLNNAIQNISHKLNESTIVVNSSEILQEISRLNTFAGSESFYPNTTPDIISNYKNATGSPLSPLESFSSCNPSKEVWKPRTLGITVLSGNSCPAGASSTVQISVNLYEPLWTPFNNMGEDDSNGFYGVNNENINVNWNTDLFSSLFSMFVPTGLTVTGTSANLSNNQYLYLKYFTPSSDVLKTIPQKSFYRYNHYDVNNTTLMGTVLPNNGSGDITISNSMCNFSTVPKKILIFAKEAGASTTYDKTEKYLQLKSINCTFNNGTPFLSGSTPDALFEVSRKNNLQMNRECWKADLLNRGNSIVGDLYGAGSILVISPLDYCLPSNLSESVGGRYGFNINAVFTNYTNETFSNVNLYIIGIYEGVVVRDGSQYSNYLLNLEENALLSMKHLPAIDNVAFEAHQKSESFAGGSLKDFLKKAYHRGHRAYQFIKKHRGAVEGMYNQAKALTNEARGQSGGRLFSRK